jgi:uncharacterized protein YndB with AHSA1/START domain
MEVSMIKIEGSVLIDRPVEKVWNFLTSVENASKWDTGIVEARQTSEGSVGLGTTVEAISESRGRRRIMPIKVTAYDPDKRVAWSVNAGFAMGKVTYDFENVEGGTRLSKSTELELKGLYNLLKPILRRRYNQSEIVLDLGNIKRNVEAST